MDKLEKPRYFRKRSRVKKMRNPPSRGKPRLKIVKRDGRVQLFNRSKMFKSIRNAGATQKEANLVTNRVSRRLVNRKAIPSKDLSSMIARSLSRVNSTASGNYINNRDRKLAYSQRVNRLSSEIAAINQQANSVIHRIESLNDRIQNLPIRISRIRQANYRVLTYLDTDQISLSEMWMKISPELRATASLKGESVQSKTRVLQQSLSYKLGGGDYNISNLQEAQLRISELRLNLSEIQSSVASGLTPLEKKFQKIDKDLRRAESTVSLVSQASFPWEEGERPVVAIKVKDLNNDLEGFITLTNLRFILEHEKEVVLKKRLFIVTEKKVTRELAIQKPIGMVSRLVRGKVGFFKGAGLFAEFASESGVPEMKFDTTSQDADWLTHNYNSIISGQVDEELATVTPTDTASQEALQPVACSICGAPYTEKIYRGQTSVNCKYCGTIITI
jgi:hypothetical protein